MANVEGAVKPVKREYLMIPPETTMVVTDKGNALTDPFYKEETPSPEWLVSSLIRLGGNFQPAIVRRDGEALQVVAGRKRRKAMIEANRRLVEAGKEPLLLKVIILRASDDIAEEIRRAENFDRVEMTPLQKSEEANIMHIAGKSEEDIARSLGVLVNEVKALITLVAASPAVRESVEMKEASVTAAAAIVAGNSQVKQDEKLAEARAAAPKKGKGKGKITVRVAKAVTKKGTRKARKGTAPARPPLPVLQTLVLQCQDIPASEGGKEFHKAAEALMFACGDFGADGAAAPGWIKKLLDKAGAGLAV